MKKYLLISLGLLMLVACGKPKDANQAETIQKKSVKLYEVKVENLSAEITGNGNFEPVKEAEHTAVAADIIKVNHKNGDRVKAGDVIVVLSDKTIEATYQSAKANYLKAESDYNKALKFSEAEEKNSYVSAQSSMISAKESYEKAKRGNNKEDISTAEANVATAKQSYEQAKFNYDKYQKLYNEKLISQAEFIQYKTTYTQAKSSLDSAQNTLVTVKRGSDAEDLRSLEAQYNLAKSNYALASKNVNEKVWNNNITTYKASYLSAKANYDLAKKEYDDLTVRAKIDGVISGLTVKPYEKTSGTGVLFYVIEDKSMEISLGLNASEINKINMDSKVELYIDELKQSFVGKVVEISPAADATTKKFMIKVSMENIDNIVKKGMYAKVNIAGIPKDMMVVPKKAVVVKSLYKYVFLNSNGVAKQVKVELGAESGDYQEIITNEIKKGDKIVIDGQYLLQDNDSLEEVK